MDKQLKKYVSYGSYILKTAAYNMKPEIHATLHNTKILVLYIFSY